MNNQSAPQLPNSPAAEQSVLGAMVLDEEAVIQGIELLDSGYFYRNAHQKIFSAISHLFDKGKGVDLITLAEELRRREELESVGGIAYLTELSSKVTTITTFAHHAKIVRDKAILRNLVRAGNEIVTNGLTDTEEVSDLLDKAEHMIFSISQDKSTRSFIHIRDIVPGTFEEIEKLSERKEMVTGVPTGFHELDEMTSGFQDSELIIIAARPSMGKTSFVLNIVQHVAIKNNTPVGIFSLEMSPESLVQRLLCSEARVNLKNLRSGHLSEDAFPRLLRAGDRLSKADIYIDDTPGINILELRAKARRLKAEHPNLGLIAIDYLQMMSGTGRSDSRQQEVSDISRSLKSLARELRIPIIALSQLSRSPEARTDKRPQLSDLRESGAIEQDADLVMFLFREAYYRQLQEPEMQAAEEDVSELIIGKQRNGPTGTVRLVFIKEYTRFENMASPMEAASVQGQPLESEKPPF